MRNRGDKDEKCKRENRGIHVNRAVYFQWRQFIGIEIADKNLERERKKKKQGFFPLKNVKFRGLIQVSAQFHYYFHKTITLHGHWKVKLSASVSHWFAFWNKNC